MAKETIDRNKLLNEQKLLQERQILLKRQKELQSLSTMRGRREQKQLLPMDVKHISSLQKQLGGAVPTTETEEQVYRRSQGPYGMDSGAKKELSRRKAYKELQAIGYTPTQIGSALAYEEGIKPTSKMPQTIGATAAGVGAALLTGGLDPTDAATYSGVKKATAEALASGLGGVAGKAGQMWLDPDVEWNAAELGKVFGEETALDYLGSGLVGAGKKVLGGAGKKAIPGAKRLSDTLAGAGEEIGIKTRFLPAQYSENQLIDTLQGIGENSLIGSDTIFQYKRNQIKSAAHLISGLADDISEGASRGSFGEAAALLVDTIEDKGISHSIAARPLFDEIDTVMAGTNDLVRFAHKTPNAPLRRISGAVDMAPTQKLVDKIIKSEMAAGGIDQPGLISTITKRIKNIDEVVSFKTAQKIRSGLLDDLRQASLKMAPDPKAVRAIKRIAPLVDEAMESAANRAGPNVAKKWRRANQFWKAGRKRYNNKIINKLLHDIPDNPDAAKVIFKSKTNILRVKKAAGPKAFQEVKGAWINKLVREAAKPDPLAEKGIGEPIGNKILRGFNGIGQEALDVAFTPVEQEAVRDSARILGIIQARTGGQAGALRFVQGSAAAGIIAAPLVEGQAGKKISAASGLLLIGPAVLGRLMTSPAFNKALSEGIKYQPGTKEGITATARLVRNVMSARREINKEKAKRERAGKSKDLVKQIPKAVGGHHF